MVGPAAGHDQDWRGLARIRHARNGRSHGTVSGIRLLWTAGPSAHRAVKDIIAGPGGSHRHLQHLLGHLLGPLLLGPLLLGHLLLGGGTRGGTRRNRRRRRGP